MKILDTKLHWLYLTSYKHYQIYTGVIHFKTHLPLDSMSFIPFYPTPFSPERILEIIIQLVLASGLYR